MWILRAVPLFALAVFGSGCGDAPDPAARTGNAVPAELEAPGGAVAGNLVEVTAVGPHSFRLSATEVPSGWTTIRLVNESPAIHFALVEKVPAGITIADYRTSVAPVFQEGMNLLSDGDVDAAMAAFGQLPEWFGQIVFTGGPGLVSSGRTAQATMNLEPGTYLIECYVKTPNGQFHSYLGMVAQLVVTDSASGAVEPEPTMEITISGEGGIESEDTVSPGEHTVAVHFNDQAAHEHFLGHDVHLVRLADGTDMNSLARWMNWTLSGGLQEPAPAEFLGGIQEMPAGATGYFNVDLVPGRYAWISEVPDPAAKGMVRTFTVGAGGYDR